MVCGSELAASLSSYLAERVLVAPNVEVLYDAEVSALDGDGALERVQLRDTTSDERTWMTTRRIFICIGGAPHTEWAQETPIVRDVSGYLVTGPDLLADGHYPQAWPLDRPPFYLETNVPGSFAAGDVRHNSVKRVASAVGEGAMAVTFVHKFLAEHAG